MINPDQIKPDMPVVCSQDGQFATVDHMEETDTIKWRIQLRSAIVVIMRLLSLVQQKRPHAVF